MGWVCAFAFLQPLLFHDGFFDLNTCKYIALLVFALAPLIPFLIRHKPFGGNSTLWIFLGGVFLAALTCGTPVQALLGSEERHAGFLFYLACGACFLYGQKAGPAPVGALCAGSALCALLGIVNFLGFDLLGFYGGELQPRYFEDFISTVGNINFFGTLMAVCAVLCAVRYIESGKCAMAALSALFLAGVLVSRSDSAVLAMALLLLLRGKRERVAVLVLSGLAVILLLRLGVRVCECLPMKSGVTQLLVGLPLPVLLAGAILLLYPAGRRAAFCAGCLALVLLYILQGSAAASGRILLWKRVGAMYAELPLWRILTGVGPDCLGAALGDAAYIPSMGGLLDNAHNEYLQLLVTCGPAALAGYCVLLINSLRRTDDRALRCALTAYAVQAFFNIAQPAVTPLIFLLLGIACSRKGARYEDTAGDHRQRKAHCLLRRCGRVDGERHTGLPFAGRSV